MSPTQPPWGEPPAQSVPQYQPPTGPGTPGTLICPKCRGTMRTYERNGIHLEQCDGCRGIFLDVGELEALTQLEARMVQPQPGGYPPQYGPEWGHRGHHQYRRRGFGGLFFSS